MGCRKVEGEILGLRAPLTSLTITFPSIHTPFLTFGALKLVYHPSLPACTPHVRLAQSSVPRATPTPSPWEPLGTCLLIEQTMESLPSDQGSVSSLHTGTLRKLKRPLRGQNLANSWPDAFPLLLGPWVGDICLTSCPELLRASSEPLGTKASEAAKGGDGVCEGGR